MTSTFALNTDEYSRNSPNGSDNTITTPHSTPVRLYPNTQAPAFFPKNPPVFKALSSPVNTSSNSKETKCSVWTPLCFETSHAIVAQWIEENSLPSTANDRAVGTVLAGHHAKSTAITLIRLLKHHSHYLPAEEVFTPLPGVSCLKTDSISWLMEKDHDILLGNPSAPFHERARGGGPLLELYSAGLEAILEDNGFWGMRGQYKVPVLWPDAHPSPKHQATFWAAGRFTVLSIIHRHGIAPLPISPFFLIFVFYGKAGLCLSLDFIQHLDPEMGGRLSPWFSFGYQDAIDHKSVACHPVGVLFSEIYPTLEFLTHSRTVEEHGQFGLTLLFHVLLGFTHEHHNEIEAYCQGFRGVIKGAMSQELDPIKSLSGHLSQAACFVATIYERSIKSLEPLLSSLQFEFHGDTNDCIAMTMAKLFRLRFVRWLHGHGHPDSCSDMFTQEELELHRHDPLLRARNMVESLVGTPQLPFDVQFKIIITFKPQETIQPIIKKYHFSFEVNIDSFLCNALQEPCTMEDPEDGTLFDRWLHAQFMVDRTLNRL
ncbi:hypothetical protein MIND_01132200 [Mycena indigotica]|uniref:Uncharacterized protein n=1 Tax=Mycena indigotica TaxID=2126181 RepID=A0A8H6VX96_9AGAR|nr:uncharacterized protein MIND_01132200 [Mycena indigotica]KAF7293538.1 hypothetical protein MIND_01132200 [Mycena indigotica]